MIYEGVEQKRRRAYCDMTTLRDAMCVWESSQQAARGKQHSNKTVEKEHKKPKKMIGRAA